MWNSKELQKNIDLILTLNKEQQQRLQRIIKECIEQLERTFDKSLIEEEQLKILRELI